MTAGENVLDPVGDHGHARGQASLARSKRAVGDVSERRKHFREGIGVGQSSTINHRRLWQDAERQMRPVLGEA